MHSTIAAGVLPGFWESLAFFPEAAGDDVAQAIFVATEARRRGIAHLHANKAGGRANVLIDGNAPITDVRVERP